MSPWFVLVVRVAIAATWLYQGLWLKVIAADPHHLAIVESIGGPMTPLAFLRLIGAGETLLALGVLSGVWHRFLAVFQIALLVAMNALGILFGGGAIERPLRLVVQNLPFILCVALLGLHGPGALALRRSDG